MPSADNPGVLDADNDARNENAATARVGQPYGQWGWATGLPRLMGLDATCVPHDNGAATAA